ncbi:MAG: hypothetical protein ACJATI_004069 [Halioglobus sp.]
MDNPRLRKEYPTIAHIDTGVLLDHTSLTLHFDEDRSNDFANVLDKDRFFFTRKSGTWICDRNHFGRKESKF